MSRRPLYLHDLTPNAKEKHVTFWWPYPQAPLPTLEYQDNLFLKQCGILAGPKKEESKP